MILQENGAWEIKEEEENIKEEGNGSAKRLGLRSDLGGTIGTQLEVSVGNRKGKGKEKASVETIVVDDD